MKNRYFLTLAIYMSLMTTVLAQKNALGVNIKVYDPLSGMGANINAVPVGFSLSYLRGFENNKFSLGGEFGIAMYSSNDYTLSYQGYDILVNEEDCFWTLHAVARYDLIRTPGFKTYAEGRIGMTTFFSSIIAHDEDSPYPGQFDFHGTAFNTGLGGGIMLNPRKLFSSTQDPGTLWIDLGASFHSGTTTEYRYMPEGGPAVPLEAGHYESLTNYMGYRLGFVFGF
jgi:hypothetical protein